MERVEQAASKLDDLYCKPLSNADGKGYVYGFQIVEGGKPNLYKVGQTCDCERRKREWSRCKTGEHIWFDGVAVDNCHRVERAVHLALEASGYRRIKEWCPYCRVTHFEIFEIDALHPWQNIIHPLILKMDATFPAKL